MKLTLLSASYDSNKQIATITFSSAIKKLSSSNKYFRTTLLTREHPNTHATIDSDRVSVSVHSSHLIIAFSFLDHVMPSNLLIFNLSNDQIISEELVPFRDWPILVENVSYRSPSAIFTKSVETAAKTIAVASAGATFFLSFDPVTAVHLLKLLSNSVYLSVLSGPFVVLPERLLRNLAKIELIPFKFKHVLSGWMEADKPCEPHIILSINSIECKFLDNYGEDMTIIFLVGILNATVTVLAQAYFKLSKRNEEQSDTEDCFFSPSTKIASIQKYQDARIRSPARKHRLLMVIERTIGLRFLVSILDGTQLEFMSFTVINILYINLSAQSLVSISFGLVVVGYYCLIGSLIYKKSSQVWASVPKEEGNLSLQKRLIVDQEIVGILYEDYKVPKRRIDLLMPLIYMVRSALIRISLHELDTNHKSQSDEAGKPLRCFDLLPQRRLPLAQVGHHHWHQRFRQTDIDRNPHGSRTTVSSFHQYHFLANIYHHAIQAHCSLCG